MNTQFLSLFSQATSKNWTRLHPKLEQKLVKYANKHYSKKRIFPLEYMKNRDTLKFIEHIILMIDMKQWSIHDVIFSLAMNLLQTYHINDQNNVIIVLNSYRYFNTIPELLEVALPLEEYDLLGLIYQSLLLEGEKNIHGIYYTPYNIVENMVKYLDFTNQQIFLDPCCGSGSFLMNIQAKHPSQIYGIDNDSLAVFIAKINLLLKYRTFDFIPNIIHANFLEESNLINTVNLYNNKKFDYIFTNPPWGSITDQKNAIEHQDAFAKFFLQSYQQLKKNGIIRFLFPQSILSIKIHKEIRYFFLTQCCIETITYYKTKFNGVFTNYIDIKIKKSKPSKQIQYHINNKISYTDISILMKNKYYNLTMLDSIDNNILQFIQDKCVLSLQNSIWALGIVTGDNKNKLCHLPQKNYEPIYSGKDILPYIIQPANKYIFYDRASLQQVAKEEYYRISEKLVYKFISRNLVFAYDNLQRLFLNSVNILIPNIPGMSIKTVLAFFNSDVYKYIYYISFNDIKILKSNLIQIKFPLIDDQINKKITYLVDQYLLAPNMEINKMIQQEIYKIFNLSQNFIEHIQGVIYGKINTHTQEKNCYNGTKNKSSI